MWNTPGADLVFLKPSPLKRYRGLAPLLLLLGCSDEDPLGLDDRPSPGAQLVIFVQQVGLYLDNGFTVLVDGAGRHPIVPDATTTWRTNPQLLTLPITAGQHTVALQGVASNCTDSQGPVSVTVADGAVGRATFTVSCRLTDAFLDRSLAFVREGSTGLWELVVASGTAQARVVPLPVGHAVHSKPTWSPDGRRLALVTDVGGSDEHGHRLMVIGTDGGDPLVIAEGPFAVAWAPSGGAIAFTKHDEVSDTGELWVAEESRGWASRILWDGAGGAVLNPTWSPDGQTVAIASAKGRDWNLVLVSAGGGIIRTLPRGDWEPDSPAWSPDGQRLAYIRWYCDDECYDTQLSVMVLATGADVTVETPGLAIRDVAWLPNGSGFIAETHYSDRNTPTARCVSIVSSGEGEVRPLMSCATGAYGVAVSPR